MGTANSGKLGSIAWISGCGTMTEPAPFGTGGFVSTRVFDAARERVWREWTEPECFADWFGGEECEVPISTVAMDVRPGGAWRGTMFCRRARHEVRRAGTSHDVAAPEWPG